MLAIATVPSFAWQAGVRASAGVWTDGIDADTRGVQVVAAALVSIGGRLEAMDTRLYAEGWVADHAFFATNKAAALREAFAEVPVGRAVVRIGRQILPWGRADQINPTDSLVSRDWQWRTPATDDQRFGNDGVEGVVPLGPVTLSGVWMPHMQTTRLPYIDGLQGVPYAAIDGRDNVGVRVDGTGERVDWGVSYYQGVDLSPSLSANLSSFVPRLGWQNYRIRRFGADVAAALGEATIRGEIAYTTIRDRVVPTSDELPGQRADYLKAVVGGDRSIGDGLDVNVQVVMQHVYGSAAAPPPPVRPVQRLILATQALVNQQPVTNLCGFAYRLQQRWLDDAWRVEVSGLAYAAGQGSTLRVRIEYRFDDALLMSAGGNTYFGAGDSILGALKPNNAWFVQMQYTM